MSISTRPRRSRTASPEHRHSTGQELINDDDVDAIIVCSWGPTHEEYVLAAIAAGKPVFCEKPLATTQEACRRIIDAEVAFGRRLVQVGYMRRYDRAYRALKAVVDSGEIGAPLMMHCTHRNPSVPGHYTRDMAITDTAVHEIDMVRWMFGRGNRRTSVLAPAAEPERRGLAGSAVAGAGDGRRRLHRRRDLESTSATATTCAARSWGRTARRRSAGRGGRRAAGRAGRADGCRRIGGSASFGVRRGIPGMGRRGLGGGTLGPSAWDGYAAAVVADAGVEPRDRRVDHGEDGKKSELYC